MKVKEEIKVAADKLVQLQLSAAAILRNPFLYTDLRSHKECTEIENSFVQFFKSRGKGCESSKSSIIITEAVKALKPPCAEIVLMAFEEMMTFESLIKEKGLVLSS